ncbi:hypothetical protein BBB03_01050 [Candidatus Portiera aleyrodidarum]|nr:hypothetical protein BBB03_01050 [Candidatus Portiera aleyrodidarum]
MVGGWWLVVIGYCFMPYVYALYFIICLMLVIILCSVRLGFKLFYAFGTFLLCVIFICVLFVIFLFFYSFNWLYLVSCFILCVLNVL